MATNQPIVLDYSNMMADVIGETTGLRFSQLVEMAQAAAEWVEELSVRRRKDLGFPELPQDADLAARIRKFADGARARCKHFVVFGIGGSALGNRALHGALNHPMHNLLPAGHPLRKGAPKIHVIDNVDPSLIAGLFDAIGGELPDTIFNVITKSGSTAETMSQFLHVRELLRGKPGCDPKRQIVITTEPAEVRDGKTTKGLLRAIADEGGYASFELPANVGGRFSCLSAVGLLSAAFGGLDIESLLKGAADMDRRCSRPDLRKNPAALYAALHVASYRAGRPISVLMPYSNALSLLADWYCQLWAESLGKRDGLFEKDVYIGPTPIRAVGVTDQHSVMQLFQDGAFDKVVCLVEVGETYGSEVRICAPESAEKELSYLGSVSFNRLLDTELKATRCALTMKRRPNLTIRMDRVSEYNMGQILMLLEHATAFAGAFFRLNAFDQPGVKLGKDFTFGLLGKAGFQPPVIPPVMEQYVQSE